jgi:hypothetical protein
MFAEKCRGCADYQSKKLKRQIGRLLVKKLAADAQITALKS